MAGQPSAEALEILGRVRERFGRATYRPPLLPDVALKVQKLARDPNADFNKVVGVLQTDGMLSASVLRRMQSPWYAGRSKIMSLKDAVVRMGTKGLRDLVWEVAFQSGVFASKTFTAQMNHARDHSIAAAHVTRLVAKQTGVPLDHAFLTGLVHDIGFAALLLVIDEQKLAADPRAEHIAEVLRLAHEETSGLVARLWKLPEELCEVLGRHHERDLVSHPLPLLAVLVVGEHIVQQLMPSQGSDPDQAVSTAQLSQASAILNLSRQTRTEMEQEAKDLLQLLGLP